MSIRALERVLLAVVAIIGRRLGLGRRKGAKEFRESAPEGPEVDGEGVIVSRSEHELGCTIGSASWRAVKAVRAMRGGVGAQKETLARSPGPDFKVHFPARFLPLPRRRDRNTKVNQDDSPSPTQHDVVRIDIAVSDPLSRVVEVPNCRRKLVRDRARDLTEVGVTVIVGREGGRIEQAP